MTGLTRRALVAGAAASFAASGVTAAPRSRLHDPRWRRFGSQADPDHGAWDAILARAVARGRDGVARFDYAGTGKGRVDAYVASLSAVDPAMLTAPAAFAYWVNAYNAVTIQVVLAHWPVRSIRDIGGGLFAGGPWKQKLFPVAGTNLSLDDIEHGILRPVWQDPRIHYAVNCASIGCPDLAPRAYTSRRMGAMLDTAAKAYINHPRGAQMTGRALVVSSIYDWFAADFGGSPTAIIAHLATYAPALGSSTAIADYRYDWSINAP